MMEDLERENAELRAEVARLERDALRVLGAVVSAAGGSVVVPMSLAIADYEVLVVDDFETGGHRYSARQM